MKRIVVPIDFSPYSEKAFLSAVKIAAKGDASITCINVVNTTVDWKNLSEKEKARHQEILDRQSEAIDKLKAFIIDHKVKHNPVEAVVEVGIPAHCIAETAKKQMADLIIIGAYGRGYEEGKFIGSTMQKVLRFADSPVLAVKRVVDRRAMKKMVFASLFNEDSRPAFVRMKPLIKSLGASVYFLYINTPSKFTNSGKAEELMRKYGSGNEDLIIHRHIYNHDEAEKGIIDFSENQKAGLIGIASNTRKSNSSYQIGVTETVLYKTEIPVLSVKFE
ncbi:universal stress protein [Negadavirga shengliensis]|uniref:Universal stress protein n=1 Tax=Negadavirga shengliensis TaxID=1389218 RepID=A0ABV9T7B6_9BACT